MLITSPVRKALPEEADEILAMCRCLWQENGQFSFSEKKVRAKIDDAFNRLGAIIGVIGETGKLQGSICIHISDYFYTDEYHLGELWNYVLPQYRKSTNAKDLIRFGMRCSDEIGIPLLIGVISNERTAAKLGLYQRILGDPAGGFFIHRPASAGAKVA
jgi:hypothetical protein